MSYAPLIYFMLLNFIHSHAYAQCYPRLTCAINGALLMQVHQEPEAAPALALALTNQRWNKKRMQIMHLMHAELKTRRSRVNGIKRPAL